MQFKSNIIWEAFRKQRKLYPALIEGYVCMDLGSTELKQYDWNISLNKKQNAGNLNYYS